MYVHKYVNQPTNNTVAMFVSGARNFATGVICITSPTMHSLVRFVCNSWNSF